MKNKTIKKAMTNEEAEHIVELVLTFLRDRKGFDAWWESVDADIQEELKNALALEIQSNPL